MNKEIIQERNFQLNHLSKKLNSNSNNSLNYFENSKNILKSLHSFGNLENEFVIDSNSYINSEYEGQKNYPIKINNHCSIDNHSEYNLNHDFTLSLESEVMYGRINNKNNYIACGLMNGYLAVVDIQNANLKYLLETSTKNNSVTSIRWKTQEEDEDIVTVINAEGSITSYDLTSSKQRYLLKRPENELLSMDYSFDNNHFIVGDNKGNIALINENSEKEVAQFYKANWFNNGHSNRIFSLKFLNDDHNLFVSGGWDGMIFVWDVWVNKPVSSFSGPKISGDSLDYKNGKLLAVSHESEDPIWVYDLKKMEMIKSVDSHCEKEKEDFCGYSANFSPLIYNYTIFSGSSNPNCVRVFESPKNNPLDYSHTWSIEGFDKGIYSTHISPDSNYLCICCGDKNISVIKIQKFD